MQPQIEIRSINHLFRLVMEHGHMHLLMFNGDWKETYGLALMGEGEKLYIFNPFIDNRDRRMHIRIPNELTQCTPLDGDKTHAIVIEKGNDGDEGVNGVWRCGMIGISDEAISNFNKFRETQKKLFQSIFNRYSSIDAFSLSLSIFIMTDESKHLFNWCYNLLSKHHISRGSLEHIIDWVNKYKQLSKDLTRNTITAYTDFRSFETLEMETLALKDSLRLKESISEFNTTQRHLLNSCELSDRDKKALARFKLLSDQKRKNVIRKVSAVDNYEELIRHIKHATSTHFDWNKDSFMDFINNVDGINFTIVFETDNVVIGRVGDFDTLSKLAKTVNWCISRNKTFWRRYDLDKDFAEQYMLFNFGLPEDDGKSIIGFTVIEGAYIKQAHDFFNNNIVDKHDFRTDAIANIHRYRPNDSNRISGILSSLGASQEIFKRQISFDYEWDKSTVKELIASNSVSDIFVKAIKDDGNILVVKYPFTQVTEALVGPTRMSSIESFANGSEMFMAFMDFSINRSDANSLYIAILYENADGDFETPVAVFDGNGVYCGEADSFSIISHRFGLPYDFIKQPFKPKDILIDAMNVYDYETIDSIMLKECGNKDFFDEDLAEDVFVSIRKSLFVDLTLDLIKHFTRTYGSLGAIFGDRFVLNLIRHLMSEVTPTSLGMTQVDALKRLESGQLYSDDEVRSLISIVSVFEIFNHESTNLQHRILDNIMGLIGSDNMLIKQLVKEVKTEYSVETKSFF